MNQDIINRGYAQARQALSRPSVRRARRTVPEPLEQAFQPIRRRGRKLLAPEPAQPVSFSEPAPAPAPARRPRGRPRGGGQPRASRPPAPRAPRVRRITKKQELRDDLELIFKIMRLKVDKYLNDNNAYEKMHEEICEKGYVLKNIDHIDDVKVSIKNGKKIFFDLPFNDFEIVYSYFWKLIPYIIITEDKKIYFMFDLDKIQRILDEFDAGTFTFPRKKSVRLLKRHMEKLLERTY